MTDGLIENVGAAASDVDVSFALSRMIGSYLSAVSSTMSPSVVVTMKLADPTVIPATIGSNDGAASFSSSLKSRNCAGAKKSRSLSNVAGLEFTVTALILNSRASAGAAAPNFAICNSSGTTVCFTDNLPSGCSGMGGVCGAGGAGGWRSVTTARSASPI